MERISKALTTFIVLVTGIFLLSACGQQSSQVASDSLIRGGKLYDNWIVTLKMSAPEGNSPLWAAQSTNTRTGSETWRCKECHGWDYKGKDGAYSKGSHYTGFPGVHSAATTKTIAELTSILKGATKSDHKFSFGEDDISALAVFLKQGAVIDVSKYIDYATKKPRSADAAKGKQLYEENCAVCHGADGKMQNFGTDEEPEYEGTIATDNPWEFFHKVRFGQPGANMPSQADTKWSLEDMMDVLAYAQTLPKE